jgi:hypothetical protein
MAAVGPTFEVLAPRAHRRPTQWSVGADGARWNTWRRAGLVIEPDFVCWAARKQTSFHHVLRPHVLFSAASAACARFAVPGHG